jgi:hypothetical protein
VQKIADLPKENIPETIQYTSELIWVIARWGFLYVFEKFIIFVQALLSAYFVLER